MAVVERCSDIITQYEESEYFWKIQDFFKFAEEVPYYVSSSFKFSKSLWQLSLLRRGSWSSDYVFELHLALLDGNNEPSVLVECASGFRKADDQKKLIYSDSITFTDWKDTYDNVENPLKGLRPSAAIGLIKVKELLQRKAVFAPSDELTILVNLKRNIADLPLLPKIYKTSLVEFSDFCTLSKNLRCLLADKGSCDVTFKVMDQEFKAHKSILIARSPVFAAMFEHGMTEQQTSIINIPDCDSETFSLFLEYLYSGEIEELNPRVAANLYVTADKYAVLELKAFLVHYLIENLDVENMCDALVLADKYDEKKLYSAILRIFKITKNTILSSSEWENFEKSHSAVVNKLYAELDWMKLGYNSNNS